MKKGIDLPEVRAGSDAARRQDDYRGPSEKIQNLRFGDECQPGDVIDPMPQKTALRCDARRHPILPVRLILTKRRKRSINRDL